ncbi:hypothetical protein IL306_006574 [Fusarium sp. DS 682]|nr:hypothetical protein IL306_006574 [Fusarium sp. DS 682]
MQPDSLKKTLDALNETDRVKIIEELSLMIYGSNMIEYAGGSLETTLQLCRTVFEEEESQPPEDVTERNTEYEDIRQHLQSRNLSTTHERVLQSYREIVQHAQAAKLMIESVCIDKGKDLSEAIIKEAHAILTYKIDINPHTPWIYYSGVYRTWNVRCGGHIFMDENRVPAAMRDMIEAFVSDTRLVDKLSADEEGFRFRISFASKYCHRFVNIHPFADGNGRMCRLILNTLLIRWGIGPVAIGVNQDDRREYLRITVDASKLDNSQSQEEVVLENYGELAEFVQRHVRDGQHLFQLIPGSNE